MTPRVCQVCSREFLKGKTFELTAEEKAAFPAGEAPEKVHYCASCLRIMEDPESGAQLLKGLFEMQLVQSGVPGAKKMAETFHASLIKAVRKKKLH